MSMRFQEPKLTRPLRVGDEEKERQEKEDDKRLHERERERAEKRERNEGFSKHQSLKKEAKWESSSE